MVTVQFNFKTIIEAQEFLEGLSGRQPEATPSPKGPMVPDGPSKSFVVSEPKAVVLNPEAKAVIETVAASPLPPFVERATNPTATEVKELLGKKKRGPKPKAGYAAAPAQVFDGLHGTGLPDVIYGIEDCHNALSSLFDVKGREVAKSVLTEFKVDRVAYLKPEQFAAFIERCKTASQPE